MNFLIITNKVPYPLKDGGSIATFNLAKAIVQHNNQVTILAMNTSKHRINTSDIPDDIIKMFNLHTVYVNTKIFIHALLLNLVLSAKPYNAIRFKSKKFEKKLIKILNKQKYDIIQLEGLYMGQYTPVIRQYSKAKISMRAHNIEYMIWQRMSKQEKNPLKKWYISILSRRIRNMELQQMNQYDCLVPISNVDTALYQKINSRLPVFTAPAGIDIKNIQASKISEPPSSLFFIGALDWLPNQEGLLWFLEKVWPHIRRKCPQLSMHIAGRNAPKQIEEALKKPNITYYGEIDDAHEFMQSKGIMIVPLLSGSGIRIKILEGMALGKVIITTSTGLEGIHAEHKKQVLICDTHEEIFHETEKLITDKDYYNRISMAAVDFIKENFDNFAIAGKLLDFYKKLIA